MITLPTTRQCGRSPSASISPANFMAEHFNAAGLPALAVNSATPRRTARARPQELAGGALKVLCTVDLYNEGSTSRKPTPAAPTPNPEPGGVPTAAGPRAAALGRQESCLVLDFVGRLRNDFRFDLLYRAITGLNRQQLVEAVEQGFTGLPPGCHIQFDRVAREAVLNGLRQISRQTWHRPYERAALLCNHPPRPGPGARRFRARPVPRARRALQRKTWLDRAMPSGRCRTSRPRPGRNLPRQTPWRPAARRRP